MIRVTLETAGYSVAEAADAAAAMEQAALQAPDLILQDIVLPDMNGIDLLRRLRALPGLAEVPVLAFTGLVEEGTEEQLSQASFDGVLIKPVEPSALLRAVRIRLAPGRSLPDA